jgi:nitrate reductase delta subunit
MTAINPQIYESLADLLEYPETGWEAQLEECRRLIAMENADAAIDFLRFYRDIAPLTLSGLQELYTRTFDLNPVCALEIGYHLFGENYKRGELLANLRETESPYSIGQQNQLPDYLPVLLRLVVRLADEELRRSLISDCMLPALAKMNEEMSKSDNPYGDLLKAVRGALAVEAPESERSALPAWERASAELYRISSRAR